MKRLDAVAVVGEYKDKNTGEMKKRYSKCGAVFINDEGEISLKLDTMPVHGWDGWINAYEPYEGERAPRSSSAPTRKTSQDRGFDDMENDIPF
tara:strand:- start:1016 stop:1294 length:279 start_codon:yes stop_codon:yes gene_type:complete